MYVNKMQFILKNFSERFGKLGIKYLSLRSRLEGRFIEK